MHNSPYRLENSSLKLEKLKSSAASLLHLSNTSIDTQLDLLISQPSSHTPTLFNSKPIDYLYGQFKNRCEKVESIYQMLMTSIEIAIDWMEKYRLLEVDLQKAEGQKESEEKQMRQSLDTYQITVKKLIDEKEELQSEVIQVSIIKDRFKQLYENQMQSSSELLLSFTSNLGMSRRASSSEQMKRSTGEDMEEKSGNNVHLQGIIDSLRCENDQLKRQVKQLRSAITECTNHKDKLFEVEEPLKQDDLVFIHTSSSLSFQDKCTLASEVLTFGKKISDMRENGCFSYLMKEKIIDRTTTGLEMGALDSSSNLRENHPQIVRSQIVQKKLPSPQIETKRKQNKPLFRKFMDGLHKRVVLDRIKTH